MNRPFVAASGLALQASFASAAITVSSNATPLPTLPGFVSETLTATALPGEKIIGFDFVGGPINPDFGFIGPMNQINPAGQLTVFGDFDCSFFGGCDPALDSHFKVQSTQGFPSTHPKAPTRLKPRLPTLAPSRWLPRNH